MTQINSLTSSCGVSYLAAFHRLIRATDYACVLLVFQSGKLSWHMASSCFDGELIAEGSSAPAGSITEMYSKKQGRDQEKYRKPNTPAEWWIQKGDYSTTDENAFRVNQEYIYTMLTFYK